MPTFEEMIEWERLIRSAADGGHLDGALDQFAAAVRAECKRDALACIDRLMGPPLAGSDQGYLELERARAKLDDTL